MNKVLAAIARGVAPSRKFLSAPSGRGGWWPLVREPYAGAWQNNDEERIESLLGYAPAFSCITLIASDVAKLGLRLVADIGNDIWKPAESPAYSPVLRKPNHFQNRIQFIESWLLSKLSRGNTYVLKARDGRGVVTSLYVLNPDLVQPLVAPDGGVFYRLTRDELSRQDQDDIIVPAREIIHDRFNCLYHPLVGLSPIYASAVAAGQGLKIQRTSTNFFANGARPSGILMAADEISQTTADELKAYWQTNYGGNNEAKIAVLGDGLKYQQLTMTSVDAQLIEQLKWTGQTVCSTFHMPAYKIGIGEMPKYDNIQALTVEYYTGCLQIHIESIELCLDEGLELVKPYGTEFDLDSLMRMDQLTLMKSLVEGLKGVLTPDEARRRLNLEPTEGGGHVYLQQQNYSLAALAKRDAKEDPFGKGEPEPAPPPENDNQQVEAERAERRAATKALLRERVRERVNA